MKTTYLGYVVDATNGVVYGRLGQPISKGRFGTYLQIWRKKETAPFKSCQVHRLIWESVHGPIPNGLQINHINGIKLDNRIANLELVTPSENSAHAYRTGLTTAIGEKNGRAKLTETDVRLIRKSGLSRAQLAKQFNVATRTIGDVVNRKKWRYLA